VFWLSPDDPLLFVIPMLVLSLADAVAALIGISYGRLRYESTDGIKSAEGSAAFFCAAFFSVHVPLLLFTQVGRAETLLISLVLGDFSEITGSNH
jgi:phytol kinase